MRYFKIYLLVMVLLSGTVSSPTYADSNVPPEIQKMHAFLGLMQKFYGIVGSMHKVSGDPTEAAIMQMFKIQEIYEKQGKKADAAMVFKRVLKESTNPTIRNAAAIMLGDLLKETGRSQEAIEILNKALNENIKRAE